MRPFLALAALAGVLVLAQGALARTVAGPTNTTRPTIEGVVEVGATINANPGSWTSADASTISYAYQWGSCDAQGNACQLLPYMAQTVNDLRARVGGTIRVTVTATDDTGSLSSTSDAYPVQGATAGDGGGGTGSGHATVKILSPKAGAIVIARRPRLVARVSGDPVRGVRFDGTGSGVLRRGANGLWSTTLDLGSDGGRFAYTVTADLQAGGRAKAHVAFRHYIGRFITEPDGRVDSVLGCNPCDLRDKRGDAIGGGADITRFRASYRRGRITVTITTANTGGAVCVFFASADRRPGSPAGRGDVDCYGTKINNGNLDSDRPSTLAHPDAHTTVVGFALSSIRGAPYNIVKPRWLLLSAWSHAGDTQLDRFPDASSAEMGRMVKLQIVPDR